MIGRWVLATSALCACGRFGFSDHAGGDATPGSGDAAADAAVDAALPSNLAFVTSTLQSPDSLGGLAGADALCAGLAGAVGHPGEYRAWLSATGVNAIDRLAGSRGWRRIDGRPFVDTVADLAAGKIYYPLDLDENGARVAAGVVTGTDGAGTASSVGSSCGDWASPAGTVVIGVSERTTQAWTNYVGATTSCSTATPIYCFGVGNNVRAAPPPPSVRRVFLSPAAWHSGAGAGDADLACQGAADLAGLTGVYTALISTASESAAGRLPDGPLWVRVDGAELATSDLAFATGDLATPINVTADLQYVPCTDAAWTGAATPTTAGTPATTCSNWTSTLNADSAGIGAYTAGTLAFAGGSFPCDGSAALYCAER